MDGLDERQAGAVAQLREIINGADEDVAIGVLDSVDWDVQRAADLIFGNAGNPPSSSSRDGVEEFEMDDSQQDEFENAFPHEDEPAYPPRQRPAPAPAAPNLPLLPTLARPLLTLLTFPLHVLSSVFKFIFSVLRIPFPQLRFMGMNLGLNLNLNPSAYRPLRPRPGAAGPDRWLRELEEETGAVSIARSRAGAAKGTTSSLADPGHGSSSLTSRSGAGTSTSGNVDANGHGDDGRKYLPDFTISTYEDFLRTCQKETKIGCVILVSEEHDDVPEFKRTTLTDPTFVKTLYDNDILVWGGDVRDREAWSAAQKLQATTYPFIAFLALQPRRTGFSSLSSLSSSSTSTPSRTAPPPSLTVLSRHQGPCLPPTSTPLHPAGPTAPSTLTHHITTQLLPRVTPYLVSLTALADALQQERHLRAEQDQAFALAARRDKERIEGRMREERERTEAGRRAEEEGRREEERARKEEEGRRRRVEERMGWRRWTRRVVVGSDPMSTGGAANGGGGKTGETLRIAIRLPIGARVIHAFPASASLTALYALVDAQLIPPRYPASEDPLLPPTSSPSTTTISSKQTNSNERTLEAYILSSHPTSSPTAYWGFLILSAYPRVEIPWAQGAKLGDVKELKGGGQVVVELLRDNEKEREKGRTSLSSDGAREAGVGMGAGKEEEDDGYHTEDSE